MQIPAFDRSFWPREICTSLSAFVVQLADILERLERFERSGNYLPPHTSRLTTTSQKGSTVPMVVSAASHLGQAVLLLRRMQRLPRFAARSNKLAALASALENFVAEIERVDK